MSALKFSGPLSIEAEDAIIAAEGTAREIAAREGVSTSHVNRLKRFAQGRYSEVEARPYRNWLKRRGAQEPEKRPERPAGKGPSKIYLTFKQQLEIFDLLKEALVVHNDGTVTYTEPGMSDLRLAEAVDFDCTASNVARVRKEAFGYIKQVTSKGGVSREELEELSRRIDALEIWVRHQTRRSEVE